MDSLHQQLESQGLRNVSYMVVNHHGKDAQRLHGMLSQRLSSNITLYKQEDQDPDVWQALSGDKDDFLIYDRCGRLTYHISLPYSVIGQGHIGNAIRETYCKHKCGTCTYESLDIPEECNRAVEAKPEGEGALVGEEEVGHGDAHGQGHGHRHGGHRNRHGSPPHHGDQGVVDCGHEHAHGQNHQGNSETGHRRCQVSQHPVDELDLGQQHVGQQAMHISQLHQDTPVLERP